MSWLRELFSESSSISMMRVISFIITISSVLLAFSMLFVDKNFETLIMGMLSIGVAGKVGQKFGEKK